MDDSLQHQIMSSLMRIERGQGELDAGLRATNEHLIAVSKNQKDTQKSLDDHKRDEAAHGRGAETRGRAMLILGVVQLCTIIGTAIAVAKFAGN